jgi:hypothetical protein
MLASECPTASILGAPCVAVGIEVEFTNFPEIFGIGCSFE